MYKKILVSLDISKDTSRKRKTLTTAVSLAEQHQSELIVLSVIDIDIRGGWLQGGEGDQYLEEHCQMRRRQLEHFCAENISSDINVCAIVKAGHVYQNIIDTAKELTVDLIIMGTTQPKITNYLLGTNTLRVLQYSKCSLMFIRD
ncbi:hypothetical protein BA893_24095 [Vibrio natriegens]|uniref:universal stress protein n=1 Tax=Vibrio natriegens TaxID=691 RepID=UPI0008045831|nr:universal stress protein [Vibrio natriegens]ANQ24677.1 hypothetical protein BA893_24095 [Vibrio natriegens]